MSINWSPDKYAAALHFAASKHQAQKFPGTDLPYLLHISLVVGEITAVLPSLHDAHGDRAVQCAILHDILEDTSVTYVELADRFGYDVADGVQALTKNAALPKEDRMTDCLERIRKQPLEVWMIKMADRIVNLRPPPDFWSTEKRRAYREEALEIHRALSPGCPEFAKRLEEKIRAYEQYLA